MAHRAPDGPEQVSAGRRGQVLLIPGPDQRSQRQSEPRPTTSCVTCTQEVTHQHCDQSGITQKSVGSDRLRPDPDTNVSADGSSLGSDQNLRKVCCCSFNGDKRGRSRLPFKY